MAFSTVRLPTYSRQISVVIYSHLFQMSFIVTHFQLSLIDPSVSVAAVVIYKFQLLSLLHCLNTDAVYMSLSFNCYLLSIRFHYKFHHIQ